MHRHYPPPPTRVTELVSRRFKKTKMNWFPFLYRESLLQPQDLGHFCFPAFDQLIPESLLTVFVKCKTSAFSNRLETRLLQIWKTWESQGISKWSGKIWKTQGICI